MGCKILKEEQKWYNQKGHTSRKPKLAPEHHNFPHRLVRSKLYDALAHLGCNQTSAILSVGCGSSGNPSFAHGISKNIIGIDISPNIVRSWKVKGYEGVLADAKLLPFKNDSFDYVVCSAILHHLVGQGNLVDYLGEFARVTRQKGSVIALEPNLFNISGILMNILNTIKPRITGLVPYERALSPLYLCRVFKEAGLKHIKCITASYTWNRFPLWISKCIAKYEDSLRLKKPFSFLGWLVIVWGEKGSKG